MGGILTDAQGRSTIDGLWACGEVASTGAHGANRLASNSLLEAVVFGARVANDIASSPEVADLEPAAPQEMVEIEPTREHDRSEHELRRTMTEDVGVIRDIASLAKALLKIGVIEGENEGDWRLANMLTTAKLITAAAYQRKESRGAHFRSDYPTPNEALAKRSFLTLADAERISREAVEAATSRVKLRAVLHA
jgi:L-aspartate oxidase